MVPAALQPVIGAEQVVAHDRVDAPVAEAQETAQSDTIVLIVQEAEEEEEEEEETEEEEADDEAELALSDVEVCWSELDG